MPGDRIGFRAPDKSLEGFGIDSLARLASGSGDVALILAPDGRVLDASFSGGDPTGVGQSGWIGRNWADLVTSESVSKIAAMLEAAATTAVPRWRQVNHPTNDGDVPIRYLAVGSGAGGNVVAVGQDLRATSVLQQRLIQAQQSMERDYLKLRQAEARYRMLFDLDSEAVLIIDAETRRIREANPAATALAKAKPGGLVTRALSSLIHPDDHEALFAHLGMASASDGAEPVALRLVGGKVQIGVSATAFRQDRTSFYLVRLLTKSVGQGEDAQPMRDLIERLPDGFVLTDSKLLITSSNAAFVDLSEEASAARLNGASLGDYLGRSGIDVDLMVEQINEHGVVRNVATILRGRNGAVEEVEVSAVPAPSVQGDGFGFSIRSIGRRARDLPPQPKDMPRSVEQLTELVGRMSLKDIVRESTDLIERLCIEAALEYTSDNRASAAEILGVSRQSLYSKLHRHGLGNLVGEEE
jgi:transcriptional regulator PpsR